MEDPYSDQEVDYHSVVKTLVQTFGQVISEDVISSIVGSFNGDLDESANAIVNMISDNQTPPSLNIENPTINQQNPAKNNEKIVTRNSSENLQKCNESNLQNPSSNFLQDNNQCSGSNLRSINQPSMSYPGASQNVVTSALVNNSAHNINRTDLNFWTHQIKQIFVHYNEGSRVLIIMRGVPGSGKSFLARQILEATVGGNLDSYKTHIFSADDYFTFKGYYHFDKLRLPEVHSKNQKNAAVAMSKGVSPVIIDNTNIEIWEMEPYVREGVKNGYLIEIVEPNTPWAKRANQLTRKNVHGVSVQSIKRMLENFQNGVNPGYLIKYWGLSYPGNMVPPVLRNVPVIPVHTELVQFNNNANTKRKIAPKDKTSGANKKINALGFEDRAKLNENDNGKSKTSFDAEVKSNEGSPKMNIQNKQTKEKTEKENKLEEFAKVEAEWDNGENWEDNKSTTQANLVKKDVPNYLADSSKPQRKAKNPPESKSDIENVLLECQDWTNITKFMTPWDGDVKEPDETPPTAVEKVDSSTCIESGDTDITNTKRAIKILSAIPRDINLHYMPLLEKKVPEMRMLDKSSMTNEHVFTEAFRCKNEEKHFKTFRNMFQNLRKADLRDVFESCCGDVNWAVSIVLDGMANKELSAANVEELSEDEEENQENDEEKQCECLAAYNIIPDQRINSPKSVEIEQKIENTAKNITSTPKKVRKETVVSESSINLKRQIEKNVVISDTHYSEHCLKLRKLRRGEQPESLDDVSEVSDNGHNLEEVLPSTSKDDTEINLATNSDETEEQSDDGDSGFDYVENTVNIDLGRHFVSQLDEYFGRNNMIYPESVKPIINIPVSLLSEINALWMESLMDQLEKESKQTEVMMKQDEEIARQLVLKEMELAKAGKEPEVPDFKEIMDMEYALSLYHKDVAEWRNNEPNDLAAKLTRDKLYDLFPSISKDVLCELLMAHDNNFLTTVEGLLMSIGETKILEKENGLNNFIMSKEMERQEKLLEEQKKALSEVEWPLLPKVVKVDMEEVEKYRREADMHLAKRNLTYQKAHECVQRGMTNVASYYSEVAAMHARGFEKASCLAAASLIQVHSANNPDNSTIDLHFLRVREAKESIDLFLDVHIKKLQDIQQTSNVKSQTLYFITGRGLHSGGIARIKPAVKKRLRERGIAFKERNPGLLTAKINADDKMTHQVV